ncbi:MAG TPA: M4 family metallopeptidase [Vicinamibacterales bacterium]|nr:M4 family metallopeptidase [Vicinamibacterales bacterium]
MRLTSVRLFVFTLAFSSVAGVSSAQETRVTPRGLGALREWDRRVTADVRSGDLRRRSVREDTLIPGRSHERFDQYVRGVRVYGADIARQRTAAGQTVSVFGTIYDGIDVDTDPALSQADAKRRIEALGGAALGEARQPELVVLPLDAGGFALAWHERVLSPSAGTLMAYFIDADTGALLKTRSELKTQSAVGRGTGVLGDEKKMSVSPSSGRFLTRDELRPPDVLTFDMKGNINRVLAFLNGQVSLNTTDLASDDDNVWTDGAAVDAHAYAGFTYDYYFKRFGRRGLNDNNSRIVSLVHPVRRQDIGTADPFLIGLFYLNAAYFGGGVMVYGEGLPPGFTSRGQYWDYLAGALDIVAHELTHGVTEFTSDLIYQGESGALNESFSDIMGAAAEFFFQERGTGNLRGDWLIGEDVIRPGGLRSMSNPASYGDPDHYSVRFTGTGDNGGVHINSGIPNLAFYLAVEGGAHPRTGAAVQGVGFANREQIEKIFYRAVTQLMPASTNFSQARAITLQAARDLYGAGSAPERAMAQAWDAVGVF